MVFSSWVPHASSYRRTCVAPIRRSFTPRHASALAQQHGRPVHGHDVAGAGNYRWELSRPLLHPLPSLDCRLINSQTLFKDA